jgi:hypothetical protein
MVGPPVNTETANAKGSEFRFAARVSQVQRHDPPELASGTQQSY